MPPRLVLDKLDLGFRTTGLLILRSTVFFVVIAGTVDGTIVLDEGVATEGGRPSFLGSGRKCLLCPEVDVTGSECCYKADKIASAYTRNLNPKPRVFEHTFYRHLYVSRKLYVSSTCLVMRMKFPLEVETRQDSSRLQGAFSHCHD